MDKDIAKSERRHAAPSRAVAPSSVTRWVPPQGENRITGMIESRPDWVISRQRAWGVPIAVFVKEKPDGSVEILQDADVERAHRRGLRGRGRRRLVQAGRARALPRQARQRGLEEGRRHSRRLVRLRLDARLRAGRPGAFPAARRHQAQDRRRQRHRDVSRRLATSIAAGSTPRCWKAAARAAARRSTSC